MRVLVDVDGVVCQMFPNWIKLYNDEFGDSLDVNNFTAYDEFWTAIQPEAKHRMQDFLHMGDRLYTTETPEVLGAKAALERLRAAGDHITFATAIPAWGQLDAKIEWLQGKRIMTPKDELVAVVNHTPKHRVRGDVLIDDKPESVNDFISYGGIGVMFDQPWNRNDYATFRLRSWSEIGTDGIHGWLQRAWAATAPNKLEAVA